MGYGPNESYPRKDQCESCGKDIWVQYSGKSEKEYATNNREWEQGTQGAKFHSCFNWFTKERLLVTPENINKKSGKPARFDDEEPIIIEVRNLRRVMANILDVLIRIENKI